MEAHYILEHTTSTDEVHQGHLKYLDVEGYFKPHVLDPDLAVTSIYGQNAPSETCLFSSDQSR